MAEALNLPPSHCIDFSTTFYDALRRAFGASDSVTEVALTGEHHGDVVLVAGRDDLVVTL